MVSVAVPFGLAYALDHGYVKEGDTIFLMGTAAGMTVNMLANIRAGMYVVCFLLLPSVGELSA